MKCPECGYLICGCVDSRMAPNGSRRVRRYECPQCKIRFNTEELYSDTWLKKEATRASKQIHRKKLV